MLAALTDIELAIRPLLLSVAERAGLRLRTAPRLRLCVGVEVVLDLWKTDPDIFRPKPLPQPRWHGQALCLGMGDELFFRGSTVGPPTRRRSEHEARGYCQACPVIRDCLSHAFTVPEYFGVWGGVSARQRKALLPMIETGAMTVDEAVTGCLTMN